MMIKTNRLLALLLMLCALGLPVHSWAEDKILNVAVASNFVPTMTKIVARYRAENSQTIQLLSGSTGKHYLQISYGAPIDIFFAADTVRPQALVAQGKASQPFTYAVGQLAYWLSNCQGDSTAGDFYAAIKQPVARMSLPNPQHAPYGKAAQQTLMALSRWQDGKSRGQLVFAENASQSYQFIQTKAVQSGFIAYANSQPNGKASPCVWQVPSALYEPIRQDAAIIHDSPAARDFIAFFKRPAIQQLIRAEGYALP